MLRQFSRALKVRRDDTRDGEELQAGLGREPPDRRLLKLSRIYTFTPGAPRLEGKIPVEPSRGERSFCC